MSEYKNLKIFSFVKIENKDNINYNKIAIVIYNTDEKIIIQFLENENNLILYYNDFKNIKLQYIDIYNPKIDIFNLNFQYTSKINLDTIDTIEIPNNYYKLTKKDWEVIYNIDDLKKSLFSFYFYKLSVYDQNSKTELY